MNLLLTGGTGLIGRALCQAWHAQGHTLYIWSRRPQQVPLLCGAQAQGVANLRDLDGVALDAVINLAGAPIADRPWTAARRRLLLDSRVRLTHDLVAWLAQRQQRPDTLISGSAVGWYGDGGDIVLDESRTTPGNDFAARLCFDWEQAALGAQTLGMRVVLVRTGLVLAPNGGLLARLLPLFRMGLGGRQGNGKQWMPWIHLDDEVALIDWLLHRQDASGPYNACSPQPVRNAEFTRLLAAAVRRPALLPVPAIVLRTLLGDMSALLLGGQNLHPERLHSQGYDFRHTRLEHALASLLPPNQR